MKIHYIKFAVKRIGKEDKEVKRICVFDRDEEFVQNLNASPDPVKFINDDYFKNRINMECIEYLGSFVSDENQLMGVVEELPL